MMIVDRLPKETAKNVIRINSAGIGFSQNGINGVFKSAWTIDGTLNMQNIKFIVMGDGPLKSEFEDYAREKNVNAEFLGRLEYEKMTGILCACDIAVNPIKAKSAGSIINKVADYAAAGLPVINTQECEEYRNLVENYKIGFNCCLLYTSPSPRD